MRDAAFDLNGLEALICPEGALWLADSRTLVVADLHFEKGSAFAARGTLLPPHDTAETLARLNRLAGRLAPRLLVALGDSFHDTCAGARIAPSDREALTALANGVPCVWIEGNHDPEAPGWLPGARAEAWQAGRVVFRHEPGGPLPDEGWAEVAGHLHPCAKVRGASGRRVRRRCLAENGRRHVLPAFGAFTGGLNVLDPAFAPLFPGAFHAHMLGAAAVHAVASAKLEPDTGRR